MATREAWCAGRLLLKSYKKFLLRHPVIPAGNVIVLMLDGNGSHILIQNVDFIETLRNRSTENTPKNTPTSTLAVRFPSGIRTSRMVAVKVCAAGTRFLNNRNRNVEASGVILLSPLKKLIHRLEVVPVV